MNGIYLFCCESFMADRTVLGSTTLHYQPVWQAMVSVFRTYIQKSRRHTLENGFQGAIKRQGGPFLSFAQVFSAFIVKEKPARTGSYYNMPTCAVDYRSIHNYVCGRINNPLTLN